MQTREQLAAQWAARDERIASLDILEALELMETPLTPDERRAGEAYAEIRAEQVSAERGQPCIAWLGDDGTVYIQTKAQRDAVAALRADPANMARKQARDAALGRWWRSQEAAGNDLTGDAHL